ncbi:pilus assembly protein, partial [Sphingomonas sp.]|uniref:TadE/TadG family type IV pilus assembly protein n=1 Tax=Sphingomonas sp. TaxID=28214 RepID=UPI00286D83FD
MIRRPGIRRDERGASVVELALVAPFLAAMLIGMVDMSNGYSDKLQLEQAAQRSIEKAMNGDKNTDLF